MNVKKDFIPAWHYNFLTPLYHPFMYVFFSGVLKKIANLIDLKSDEKLLDIGCGPGNLLQVLNKKYPTNKLIGLDIDSKILKIARRKLSNKVKLIKSSATNLPLPYNSLDVVTSTLMIHHLETSDKEKMIKEAYRVLKPGGRFYLFDFAKPTNLFGRIFVKLFREAEGLDDAINEKYAKWMKDTGFKNVKPVYKTYGMLELFFGEK